MMQSTFMGRKTPVRGAVYRTTHATFEDYCRDRWQMERRHAYRLIDAAQVVGNVSQGTQIEPPATERQARPLTVLEPEAQRDEVMRQMRADGMTYQEIASAVGVSHPTVMAATKNVNVNSYIENARGQIRPASYNRQPDDEHTFQSSIPIQVDDAGDTGLPIMGRTETHTTPTMGRKVSTHCRNA
jgi:DNA-binding CsgD family transcriptional regulator